MSEPLSDEEFEAFLAATRLGRVPLSDTSALLVAMSSKFDEYKALTHTLLEAVDERDAVIARLGERGEQLEGALIDARRTIAEMVAALTAPVEHHLSKRIEALVSPVEPPT
jgi:hypothetical protein